MTYHQLTEEEQADILLEVQAQLGVSAMFLEKDYWVCQVLASLFSSPRLNTYLCFRGGTSLSKVFGCIHRFSEDIDIALSPDFFVDMPRDLYPVLGESSSQRDRKQRKMREYYRNFMRNELIETLNHSFKERGIHGVRFELEELDKARDPFVLYVHYPSVLKHEIGAYVAPVVKLELSGRAETTPSVEGKIDSYIAQVFPELGAIVRLEAVSPTRTFWEKAFILHEANTRGGLNKPRLSRHYYDWDALIRKGFTDMDLFEQVKNQRAVNYAYSWVDYEHLTPSQMNILPTDDASYQAWAEDYKHMRPMLFGEVEEFDVIMQRIREYVSQTFID